MTANSPNQPEASLLPDTTTSSDIRMSSMPGAVPVDPFSVTPSSLSHPISTLEGSNVARKDRLIKVFEGYRGYFDENNERRERMIISSRQITALSKKLIFHLHRSSLLPDAPSPTPADENAKTSSPDSASPDVVMADISSPDVPVVASTTDTPKFNSETENQSTTTPSIPATNQTLSPKEKLLAEAQVKLDEIKGWLQKVADEIESTGNGEAAYWQYQRNISGGLQEFIESISFMHYLSDAELISPEQLAASLTNPETGKPIIHVSSEDYALGISDLSGELMRYATNCSGSGNYSTALHVCNFVRSMKAGLDASQPFIRDLSKKQQVTSQSLEKIEKICYAIQLRILEYADRPDVLARLAKRALEDTQDEGPLGGMGVGAGEGEGHARESGGGGRGRGGRGGGARGTGRGGGSGARPTAPTERSEEGPPRKKSQVSAA